MRGASSVTLVVALTSSARADGRNCVVAGTHVTVEKVSVQAGPSRFDVDVHDVPVIATARGRTTTVEVGGAIAFAGTVKHKLWYTAGTEIVDGGVTLSRGAHIVGERGDGDRLIGSAVLYAEDVMAGENKPADETVSAVRARCDQLTLDWIGDDTALDLALAGADSVWRTRNGNSLVLRSQPNDAAPAVTYRAPNCDGKGCITVAGIERRGAWLKVGAHSEGVTVTGWVRARRLQRVPDDEAMMGHSYMCTGDHGGEMSGRWFGDNRQPRPARIRVGTRIYARPNAGVWATVQRDEGFKVAYATGDQWAEVVQIPNVELGIGSGYVLVASLIAAP